MEMKGFKIRGRKTQLNLMDKLAKKLDFKRNNMK